MFAFRIQGTAGERFAVVGFTPVIAWGVVEGVGRIVSMGKVDGCVARPEFALRSSRFLPPHRRTGRVYFFR